MIIDADSHYTPPPEVFNHSAIQPWYTEYQNKKQKSFSDINQRLEEFKLLKIDRQLLNFMGKSLNITYQLPQEIGVQVMKLYNNHLKSIIEKHSVFDATIWLALQDIDACMLELNYYSPQDFFAIYLGEAPHWGFIEKYDQLFKYASDNNIPLYLHQTANNDILVADSKFTNIVNELTTLWPGQYFWKRTIASFILGGVFDRFPNLRLIIVERDIDWIKNFCNVMIAQGWPDPMPYFKHNCWFTIEPEMPDFVKNANFIGWNRLLFATDWPHDRDIGGRNSRYDVDTVNKLPITLENLKLITSQNYLKLKNRI